MTVTVWTYLAYDFTTSFLQFLLSFSLIEKIHQALKTVFDQISKHLEVRQKYSTAHAFFNSPLSACKYRKTWSVVLHWYITSQYQKLNLSHTHKGRLRIF